MKFIDQTKRLYENLPHKAYVIFCLCLFVFFINMMDCQKIQETTGLYCVVFWVINFVLCAAVTYFINALWRNGLKFELDWGFTAFKFVISLFAGIILVSVMQFILLIVLYLFQSFLSIQG